MDATTYFLTYPRSGFNHDEVYNALQHVKPVQWARVAREAHADGEIHIHVCVKFGARVKTRTNMRIFDIDGRHPNIQVCRKIKDVLQYIAKDGNYQDYGQVPENKCVHEQLKQFATSGLRDEFDQCAMANRISFQWAEHIWKRHGTATSTILEAGQGSECLQLQSLSFESGTIVLVGPSGCGKSTWAKRVSPKPALWVNHLDDLKKLTKEHKCIIFDDMDFQHLPRTTQIYLVDQDDPRTIHCRHSNATIPANTPKIFTANNYPFIDDEAIRRRAQVFNVVTFAL